MEPLCGPWVQDRTSLLYPGIVLIAVDGAGDAILSVIQSGAVPAGQMAVISASHPALFAIDGNFAPLQIARLMPGELAASHALRDAVLLAFLPLLDGG